MANYLVMTVKAVDNDTGDNGKINYHLQVYLKFLFYRQYLLKKYHLHLGK